MRKGTGPVRTWRHQLEIEEFWPRKNQARGGRISGVATGFSDIDSLLGGLQPSDLLILAVADDFQRQFVARVVRQQRFGCLL